MVRKDSKMGMDLRITAESGYLLAVATGHFSIQEGKRTFLEILDAVARENIKKVLFDGRKLTGKPKIIERFYYGEYAAKEVLRFPERGGFYGPQFAYVLKPPVLDPLKFGETVAVNRGMIVKAFDNVEDALAWLLSAAPDRIGLRDDA